jgi:hypothetical protein
LERFKQNLKQYNNYAYLYISFCVKIKLNWIKQNTCNDINFAKSCSWCNWWVPQVNLWYIDWTVLLSDFRNPSDLVVEDGKSHVTTRKQIFLSLEVHCLPTSKIKQSFENFISKNYHFTVQCKNNFEMYWESLNVIQERVSNSPLMSELICRYVSSLFW